MAKKEQGVDAIERAISWTDATEPFRVFWEERFIREIRGTKRRVERFRGYGQIFRLVALLASATVTAFAGFDGPWVKPMTALAGIVAVAFTGASAIFRVDQRVIANRKAESDLLGAGWRFVMGCPPYAPGPGPATFPAFVEKVEDLLQTYSAEYNREIDRAPA